MKGIPGGTNGIVSMLKLFPKLKTNKSLKLLLVDIKANSSIPMRFEMARMA